MHYRVSLTVFLVNVRVEQILESVPEGTLFFDLWDGSSDFSFFSNIM